MGILYMIYCHSPGGDTAAALGNSTFCMTYARHHSATLQQPWRSLRSMNALLIIAVVSVKVVFTAVLALCNKHSLIEDKIIKNT